jgi:hypothetical protein
MDISHIFVIFVCDFVIMEDLDQPTELAIIRFECIQGGS